MKIKVYVTCYIKPEFIDLQVKYLNKFCQDNFELVVINNALNKDIQKQIEDKCVLHELLCINVIKNGVQSEYCSQSHIQALEYALNSQIKLDKKTDIVVIMDNDVFPFREFSFEKLLNNNLLAGIYQQRNQHEYTSAIFMMISSKVDLTNFSFFSGIGDTGAAVQSIIKQYDFIPEWVDHTAQIDMETNHIFRNNIEIPYESSFRSQFIANSFFHYYRGSNWQESDPNYHNKKFNFLLHFLENSEKYDLNLDSIVHYPKAHSEKSYNGIDFNYHNYRFILTKEN